MNEILKLGQDEDTEKTDSE
jgi:hypothetical protein